MKQIETDLVIIGGGGSGLAAAVAASGRQVKRIVVMETLKAPGGNSLFPDGFFAVNSRLQQRSGIETSGDESFQTMMNYAHWRLNSRLVRTLIDESGSTVDWLEDIGVKFELRNDFGPARPDNKQFRISFPFRVGEGKTGLGVTKVLVECCKEKGIDILYNTRAKKLVMERGAASGVVAESAGEEFTVSTKSVIIASGGFAGNNELIKRFLPPFEDEDELYIGAIPHRGDGVKMAEEIGAAMESTGAMELTVNRFPWSPFIFLLIKMPLVVWVNKKGQRFADESGFGGVNNIWKQPGKISYVLFDENIKHLCYQQQVSPMDKNYIGNKFNDLDDESKSNPWLAVERDLRGKQDTGRIKIADNWADIAGWMNIDTGVLRSTIGEYNSGCSTGNDYFAKDASYSIPLIKPPFYAIKTILNLLVTHGVIRTSPKMEVMDKEDNPIPGVFVAGDDIGGTDENIYGALGGHSFGFAITSGRLAGESAASYLSRK